MDSAVRGSAGLDALEAYHSDHDATATKRYLDLADRLAVAVSGGSDYHGDQSHGGVAGQRVAAARSAVERLKDTDARR